MKKLLLLILVVFILPIQASAAIVYVNRSTGNDTTGDGSSGAPYKTFHKAYTVANANDTINLTGVFTWTDADETGDVTSTGYTISKNLTIIGQGASTTIIQAATASTTGDRRVFTIANTAEVTIRDLTIQYGRVTGGSTDGGGIRNSGTTTIDRVEFRDNTTTGYFGGAYSNLGSTTISNSNFYRNLANYAGGFVNLSTSAYANIWNTTFSYNRGTASSGYPYGGALMIRYGTVALTNNTIVYNTAYGAGAGVHQDDTASRVLLKNNIIAYNTSTSGSSAMDYNRSGGNITDNGYNIIGATAYTFSGTGGWNDTNRDGVFTLNTVGTNSQFSIEQYPSRNDTTNNIFTHALYVGSIAIDGGDTAANGTTSVPTTDARGASRNGSTDIGAFEYNGGGITVEAPTTQLNNITFASTTYNRLLVGWNSGNGARRVVFVKEGNSGTASPVDGVIYSARERFGDGDQIGTSGWYSVFDGVASSSTYAIVSGLKPNTTYIFQGFEYNGVASSSSEYMTATATNNPNTQTTDAVETLYTNANTGNDSTGDGSSGNPYKTFTKAYTEAEAGDTIRMTGTFTLTDADETGDASPTGFTIAKDLTIDGSGAHETIVRAATASSSADRRVFTIPNNISATVTDMMIRNGRVTGSTISGGGISNSGILYVSNVDFNNNISTQYFGGGLVNFGTTTIENSSFTHNAADPSGGGISNLSTTAYLSINNTTVAYNRQTANTAYTSGGGINIRYGRVFISNSTVAYNSAFSSGSGIYMEDTTSYLSMVNTMVIKNTKWGSGAVTDFAKGSGGTITDSGHNIIGGNSGFTWTGFRTWLDTDLNGIYTQNGTGATGYPHLDTALGYHNNPNRTYTITATSSSSIFIDNGTTTASTTISNTDQRGASRNGTTDIGAHEYNGSLTDTVGPYIYGIATSTASATATITWYTDEPATSTILYGTSLSYGSSSTTPSASTTHIFRLSGLSASTVYNFAASSTDLAGNTSTSTNYTITTSASADSIAPTVEVTLPLASAATSSTVTLIASSSDNVAVAGVRFYINNVAQGSEDTSAPYSLAWDSTATSSGTKIVVAVARDTSNNYATSSGVTFTLDNSSLPDNTVPTVEMIVPTTSEATSSTVTLVATSSDNVAVAGVRFFINGTYVGSEDTSAPYSLAWDSTATSSGSKTVRAVSRDTSNNYATSTAVTFTTSNPLSISSLSSNANNTTATISWTTNTESSSKVNFGPTTNYGSTTLEIHVAPRITNHSLMIFGLPRCAYFNYIAVSRDASGNAATSSNNTFQTTGCIGSATITGSQQGAITTSAGGTLTNDRISLTVPTSFTGTSSSATFQANKLDGSTFFGTAGNPTGKNRAGNTVFNLKALTDATTTLSSFVQPITVTMEYEDADIDGIDEDSLWIYRYDDDEWFALDDCTVDTNDKEVTCTTNNFSDFALFGDEEEEQTETAVTESVRKSTQTLQNRIENIIKYSAPVVVAPAQTTTFVTDNVRDLELGMNGDDVVLLQQKLITMSIGPKARALASIGATGYFGPYTKEAVIELQLDKSVYPPHGYFGPRTRAVLK